MRYLNFKGVIKLCQSTLEGGNHVDPCLFVSQRLRIYQVKKLCLGFVVIDRVTSRPFMIHVDLPTTPVPLDRNTAENNVAAILRQNRIPHAEAFQQCFPLNVVMPVVDRHPSNLKAEQFFKSENPDCIQSLYSCSVHKKASCVKHSLSVADPVVTGVVNVGLSQTGAGSLDTLRSILNKIFANELEIIFGDPPEHAAKHRAEVLDLFVPVCVPSWHSPGGEKKIHRWKNMKRRMILNYFCNSDITQANIIHHCSYGCCSSPEETHRHFATYVCYALIPSKCPIFSRKSWTGADMSFEWFGLLSSFWNLAERVLIEYTGYVKKDPFCSRSVGEPILQALRGGLDDEHLDPLPDLEDWADLFSTSATDAENKEAGPANAGEDIKKTETQWAEFNKSVKKKVGAFVSFEHTRNDVVIVMQAIRPGLSLLHSALHMASDQWTAEQETQSASGKPRLYRVLECANNKFEDMCVFEVQQQMFAVPLALPLESYTRRSRSLLSRLQSALLCRAEFTIRHHHKGHSEIVKS